MPFGLDPMFKDQSHADLFDQVAFHPIAVQGQACRPFLQIVYHTLPRNLKFQSSLLRSFMEGLAFAARKFKVSERCNIKKEEEMRLK